MSENNQEKTLNLPLLPLRDMIIFPHMVVPLFVGREKSIAALEESVGKNNELFLVTQKDASILNPERTDVYDIGTVVSIIQMLRLPDNTVKVLIEGKYRAKISTFKSSNDGYWAEVVELKDGEVDGVALEAVTRSVKTTFEQYVKLNKRIPPELLMSISSINDPSRLADIIVAHMSMKIPEKQEVLEADNVEKRLHLLLEKMQGEIEIINVERKIRNRVKTQMEKSQKEYYLNEQINAIQRELGQKDDGKGELEEFEEKLKTKAMPEEAADKVRKEIRKLKNMSPMSAESAVVRNYIDWMLSLPWQDYTKDDNSLESAKKVLEEQHYGLKDVKDRIIEYLAVRTLVKDKSKGTILCLAGPPGVGKTSIGTSLAEALGRSFVRISLGGVRDEAEIRGHRRTYVGAMPGKIIQALKKAKTGNPLILLDEIDKMSSDMRGDPASAMLEVLDPEQNKNFADHYIEVEYDLSKVMFVMTANDVSKIPGPLKDRMEIITIPGYTPDEKLQIGKQYLLSKAIRNNGLDDYIFKISDSTIAAIIDQYTREAGVRELERMMNTIARKTATNVVDKQIAKGKKFNISISQLKHFLGPCKFDRTDLEIEPQLGLVNGLAWTAVGGEVLNIEVVTHEGTGKLSITGKLGEVMQESAKAALSYVRSISDKLGVIADWYNKHDIHIHVPEGATPKDGPSAGITMMTALTSAIAGIKVWQNVAMTGEVTIRGRVLPIGGLKEKLLAAKQYGMKKVIIPKKNEKDLQEIPDHIKDNLEIIPVTDAEEVLRIALEIARPETFMKMVGLKVVNGGEEVSNGKLEVANH
ncbi:MAG: endopeptidase La [Bdellovibrionales bacterium RIFOXYD12_FULL_39_22]|nr:MAG: endopeptidase La [Bdellovibrionales bacterium RIFOXYB1_FULL_39_21]OFZ41524.1 MAG: endopeptidase La [Bdellovibrionales bacterium RIFOXYC12_FULL_39_17]OFZ45837.1 MAG: endopeptidase La [Bdellovibrionales bacterium RIFOXYC1_FULL_39_130]OFZ74768.1 MAG: endopeptidase La [Bdellovibrionales bacterium RIFOXYD1_FULL_39_84]OFZ92629.1 MAG: endopeptidase La [Bdellovibrionales bacterium RIFOXYD12_FULL_39_22]HLE11327.1 endopeptidase La [Bacteriovoracaceae bacterium]